MTNESNIDSSLVDAKLTRMPEFLAQVLEIRETEAGGMGFNILTEGGVLGLYAGKQMLASYRPRVGDVVRLRVTISGIYQEDRNIRLVAMGPAAPVASEKARAS